jgi:hypothetical protein
MKLRNLFVFVLVVAALSSSAALAAPPATHPGNGSTADNPGNGGKPSTTGTNCRPKVTVVLHGEVAVAPGTSPALPFALQVSVKSTNAHGQAYIKATQPVTITVTTSTRIVDKGKASLSSLLAGDQLTVQARTCRADLANGAAPALTARMIVDQQESSTSDSDTTTTTA